jgi:membrane protein
VTGALRGWIERGRSFLGGELWSVEPVRGFERRVLSLVQFVLMVATGFVQDRLLLWASALTYFTVLSLVPLLAVAVSIASAVGVGSGDFVDWVVGTVAAGSPEAQRIFSERIGGVNFAGIGTLGAAVLFVTTVLAISNVERALNEIWGVRKVRSWARRFPDYLAVLVVGPLLGGIAISLSTTLRSEWLVQQLLELPQFEMLYEFGLKQAPWIMLSFAFAFMYWFIPNTRVSPFSALLGGFPAGLLVVFAQGVYVDCNIGVFRAHAFFGSIAWLPLLFVWIYVFWAIVLFGAEIAFAHQNLHLYRREVRGKPPGAAEREAIGLRIALEVARRFRDGMTALDSGELSDFLGIPVRTVRTVVEHLTARGIVLVRAGERSDEGLQLGRPAERILVTEVLDAVRGEREPARGDPAVGGPVESLLSELDEAAARSAAGRSLADLMDDPSAAAGVDPLPTRG